MSDKRETTEKTVSIHDIFRVLKANIFVIIIITLITTFAGSIFALTKKPTYTATQNINYMALAGKQDNGKPMINENGNLVTNIKVSISAMRAYVDTVVDFCDEGVVLDKANELYAVYTEYAKQGKAVDDFISMFKNIDTEYNLSEHEDGLEKYINYRINLPNDTLGDEIASLYIPDNFPKVFDAEDITAKTNRNKYDESSSFVFSLSIKGETPNVVKEKLRILALALKIKSYEAFGGVTTLINETISGSSQIKVSSDFSVVKTIIIFAIAGFALSLLAVYLITVMKNTVTSREELERLTNTNVLTCVEKWEE